ncbi:MAG: hypothetical protein KME06_11115 [Kastovskya adunca ATA6-11-RM4]|jgi:hypothetical protein|nr:hypothetical protein [Kastovskya adunca ATA6-11-RM4]
MPIKAISYGISEADRAYHLTSVVNVARMRSLNSAIAMMSRKRLPKF